MAARRAVVAVEAQTGASISRARVPSTVTLVSWREAMLARSLLLLEALFAEAAGNVLWRKASRAPACSGGVASRAPRRIACNVSGVANAAKPMLVAKFAATKELQVVPGRAIAMHANFAVVIPAALTAKLLACAAQWRATFTNVETSATRLLHALVLRESHQPLTAATFA